MYEKEIRDRGVSEPSDLHRLTLPLVQAITTKPLHQRKLSALCVSSGGGSGGGDESSLSTSTSSSAADLHSAKREPLLLRAPSAASDSLSPKSVALSSPVSPSVLVSPAAAARAQDQTSALSSNQLGDEFRDSVTTFLERQGVEVPQDINYSDMVVPIQLGKLIKWVQSTAATVPALAQQQQSQQSQKQPQPPSSPSASATLTTSPTSSSSSQLSPPTTKPHHPQNASEVVSKNVAR